MISGLIFLSRAHTQADEIMSLVTSKEGLLIFSFAYSAVSACFLISVSLFLTAVFLCGCRKGETRKGVEEKREDVKQDRSNIGKLGKQ